MILANLTREEFEKTVGYITTLCGYPAVSADKMNVLIDFLRVNHGYCSSDELTDAYRALASARLEEKADSFKTMTGLSASRVLQAYFRIKKKPDTSAPGETGHLSDENKEILAKLTGRSVRYQDELTEEDRKHLMRHWIDQGKQHYNENKRADLLTASSFNFLVSEGTLRVKDGQFQKFTGKAYETMCKWSEVEDWGKRLKVNEDNQMSKNRSDNFRRMMSPSAGGSLEDSINRVAVSIYYDSLI